MLTVCMSHVYVCISVDAYRVYTVQGGYPQRPEEVLGPLELVVWVLGINLKSSRRTAIALNTESSPQLLS